MMQELAEYLSGKGHYVTVITSMPQPELVEHEAEINIHTENVENSVKVIRVKMPFKIRKGYVHKALNQLSISTFFHRKIRKLVKGGIDTVIVYSPPLPLGLVGIKVKEFYGSNFLLNIQDIFPQNAIDLGILKNKFLIKYFESIERKIYRSADKITVHIDGGKEYLISNKYIQKEKIFTVNNWIHFNDYECVETNNIFRNKYGLENRFILLFAGIMGLSQNLDIIIEIAKNVADLRKVCFLIVGEGSEKKRLQNMVDNNGLQNVVFKGFVSKYDYPALAKEVDIGLVSLSPKNKTPVMPGKIQGFMAASLPIVAFLHNESDGHSIIKEAQCGYSVVPDNPKDAANLIRRVYSERNNLKRLGENGYRYALQHFSKETCLGKLEQLIQ